MFKFRFESILKLRSDEEEAAKGVLASLMKDKAILLDRQNQVKKKREDLRLETESLVHEGTTVDAFIRLKQGDGYYKSMLSELSVKIRQKDMDIIKQRLKVVKCAQERMKYEKMKENEWHQIQEAEKTQEAKTVDEIVTYQSFKTKQEE